MIGMRFSYCTATIKAGGIVHNNENTSRRLAATQQIAGGTERSGLESLKKPARSDLMRRAASSG